MIIVTLNRLKEFLESMSQIFGSKNLAENTRLSLNEYVLEIDYKKELAFNTSQIIGDNNPYVGSAYVGMTYVA